MKSFIDLKREYDKIYDPVEKIKFGGQKLYSEKEVFELNERIDALKAARILAKMQTKRTIKLVRMFCYNIDNMDSLKDEINKYSKSIDFKPNEYLKRELESER